MAAVKEFLQSLYVKEFATTWVGWDEKTGHIPAIPAAIFVYGAIFFIGQLLYHTSKLLPKPIRQYAMDFVFTMTLCGYPFGHGIMRKYHGEPGYLSAAIPLATITIAAFPNADGNPVYVWLSYFQKSMSLRRCLIKSVIQIFAGFAAFHLGMFVLSLELHPVYVQRLTEYYNQFCATDLTVPLYVGFLIEFVGVIWETWFTCQPLLSSNLISDLIKNTNSALMVSAGVHLTGMYLHPAMASGHTFGCGDTPRTAHILIYWVGPMIGAWLSVHIQSRFSLPKPKKATTTKQKPRTVKFAKEKSNGASEDQNGAARRRKKYFH